MVKITVKNGITYIDTKGINRITDGEYRVIGVTYDPERKKYRANISIGQKTFILGRFDKLEDAVEIRREAEQHKKAGDLEEWYKWYKKKG